MSFQLLNSLTRIAISIGVRTPALFDLNTLESQAGRIDHISRIAYTTLGASINASILYCPVAVRTSWLASGCARAVG